jgi:hypothetical protein
MTDEFTSIFLQEQNGINAQNYPQANDSIKRICLKDIDKKNPQMSQTI